MADPNLPIHSTRLPQITAASGLAIREDVAFSDAQGKERPRLRKATEKTLSRLQEILPRVLQPREVVLYILRAQAPINPLCQFFLGAWEAYGFTRTVLVLTNLRLLRFRVRSKGWNSWVWDQGVQSVAWADVSEAPVKGSLLASQLVLDFRNGSKERYWRLHWRDAKKLKAVLPTLLQNSTAAVAANGRMISLCPQCLAALTPKTYRCAQCGQIFKNEKTLRRFLLIPGGEYFYIGQRFLGACHAFLQLMFIYFAVPGFIALVLRPRPSVPRAVLVSSEAVLTATFLFIFFVFFTFRKLVAFFPCRQLVREFIPRK